ncbi:hypothetical protein FJZ17_02095 [Candidatus Pacearchaeota archaeon]|nr:hypothetical protein [Candidatus Pacearchaeota archaeon]
MLILHENLQLEAQRIRERFLGLFGFESELIQADLTPGFKPIPQFNGFYISERELARLSGSNKGRVIVLTSKDLYLDDKNKEEDWIFGYCSPRIILVSTARMRKPQESQSKKHEVAREAYLKRVETIAVHEIGHSLVDPSHFLPTRWVNARTGYQLDLGEHCPEESCVMHQVVDVTSPKKGEGYLLVGDKKAYNAGLDELIRRLKRDPFCKRCRDTLKGVGDYK